MTAHAGTLETLALELGHALEPLQDTLNPSFFGELGVELPREIADDATLLSNLSLARDKSIDLGPKTQALASAIAADDAPEILSAGATLMTGLAELVTALGNVGTAVNQAASLLPPEQRAPLQELATRMATRTAEAMLVSYLGERVPSLATAMDVLALADGAMQPAEDLEVVRSTSQPIAPRLHLERVPRLLCRPGEYLQQTFNWGAANFDGALLLRKLQLLLENLGVPAAIYESPTAPPSLEAFVFGVQADKSVSPPGLKADISLPGDTTFDSTIDFSELWKGTVHIEANYAAGAEVSLHPPFEINVRPPSGNVALNLRLGVRAEGTADNPLTLLGVTGGPSLRARRIGASIGADATLGSAGGALTPNVELRVDEGKLLLNPSAGDSFVQEVLPDGRAEVGFDLVAGWNPRDGLSLAGSVGGEVFIPVSANLSIAHINGLYLSIGLTNTGALAITAASQITVKLGPLAALIDRMGVTSSISFPESGGNLGVADLDLAFKPPSGVGLSIDARGILSGGGFLFHDEAQGLYAGVMQLTFQEQLTLKAFGLIATRMPDGSRGYSLIVFITAEDFRPIPLGLGFTLLGIGGMVGVHRTFDQEVLRQGLKTGTLATLLFPRDPVGNAPSLIRSLASAFPARRGSYLLGLIAKIGWFAPLLVMDLALILEFGVRQRLLALGRIRAMLPSPDNDLVRLNMEAMGVIDFDASTAAIDAVLVDSRLAHKFPITGSAALRAGFGDGPSFVLSVGGFNPRFAQPTSVPALERVAIALSAGTNPRLLCEAYFAITSNTVQFGARAALYADAAGFSVEGDIGFDVLLQLAPLHFIADFHARLQLKRGSHNLFMVALAGELEGPRPLRVSGTAKFEILWCSVSVHFDTTLVKGEHPPLPPAVDLFAQLKQALAAASSWSTQRSTTQSHGVALRSLAPASPSAPIMLDPLGQLMVKQQVVPLNTARDIDTFGGAPVAGDRRFHVGATLSGTPLSSAPTHADFAPAQYFAMSDDEKLAAPSFESMQAGCVFGSSATVFDSAEVIPAPLDYQTIAITLQGSSPSLSSGASALSAASGFVNGQATAPATTVSPAPYTLTAEQLQAFTRSGAAARVPLRRTGRARFRNDAVEPAARSKATDWAIMPTGDGPPANVDPSVRTWSEYDAALKTLNRGGARWHLVPAHELSS